MTPGSLSWVGAKTSVFGLMPLSAIAVELVTTLNDEPGGNVTLIARFSSGWSGSVSSRSSFFFSSLPFSVASWFGSNDG